MAMHDFPRRRGWRDPWISLKLKLRGFRVRIEERCNRLGESTTRLTPLIRQQFIGKLFSFFPTQFRFHTFLPNLKLSRAKVIGCYLLTGRFDPV